jgi:predicted RNase H-like nuclease (RuvC/YqgF family)
MPEETDFRKEIGDLRERIIRLEVKLEETNKRIDSLAKYARDLYDYLQRQQ